MQKSVGVVILCKGACDWLIINMNKTHHSNLKKKMSVCNFLIVLKK